MQDYEDFDLANEDDELEEFLGIPRKTPKANPDAAAKQNGHAETNGYEGEGKGHFKEANLISNYSLGRQETNSEEKKFLENCLENCLEIQF